MKLIALLLRLRTRPLVHPVVRQLLLLLSLDVPRDVVIGRDLCLHHRGWGVVITPRAVIGDRVTIFHRVTLGRSDVQLGSDHPDAGRLVVEDDVWLMTGAVVLAGPAGLRIGARTVIAANAVLTCSTGPDEVWGGVPARLLPRREDGRPVIAAVPGRR